MNTGNMTDDEAQAIGNFIEDFDSILEMLAFESVKMERERVYRTPNFPPFFLPVNSVKWIEQDKTPMWV